MKRKELREKKGKREGNGGGGLPPLASAILTGSALAAVVSALLLFLCAAVIWSGLLDMGLSLQVSIAACAVGGFVGGCVGVRRAGCRALPVGVGVGILFFLILAAVGLLALDATPGMGLLPILLVCLCSGGLAGLTGKRRKKRRNA